MDNPLVQVDPGLFFWTIATFLALVFMLAKFAWGPLIKALEERQATITKSLEDADQAKQELERLQTESTEILRGARVDAEAIISKSRSDAVQAGEELKLKARDEADTIVREAKRQIGMEKSQALREIRSEVADLSITIASKLIERNISKEDNDKLVEETMRHFEVSDS
jgi:F-type H+-transporting ATPase subunit b